MFQTSITTNGDAVTGLKSAYIADFLKVADTFIGGSGRSRSSVSKDLFQRGSHLDDLAAGQRDISTGTLERALSWLSANWPDGVDWPVNIDRPLPLETAMPGDLVTRRGV